MTYFIAIILGFIEGATEFIPVSSSGHLIIFRQILGTNNFGGLAFDAILQLSATLALLVYFGGDIWALFQTAKDYVAKYVFKRKVDLEQHTNRTLLLAIVFGTIPAIIFGLLFENWMETIFCFGLLKEWQKKTGGLV